MLEKKQEITTISFFEFKKSFIVFVFNQAADVVEVVEEEDAVVPAGEFVLALNEELYLDAAS